MHHGHDSALRLPPRPARPLLFPPCFCHDVPILGGLGCVSRWRLADIGSMASVALRQITKVYPGDVTAVDRIDLEIRDHEFVVLVGPSGCGKTTTLRMIAGLEDVTSGTIHIGDRQVNQVAPKDRDIAMVFQDYALYPHMTVYNNLAFALKLRKVPRKQIAARVQWAAELLGLETVLDRRPRQLSGGQRQRVAVGRAIVREPQVFLFDEPLSNLDAKLRVTTRAELKKLQHELKTTTVYVTHDQEEAMTLGDRVVVMHRGKVQQYGSPLEIYRRPANRFVAGFVGMPAMNFAEGTITQSDGVISFHGDGLTVPLAGTRFDGLREHLAQPVSLGVRAESIQIVSSPQSPNSDAFESTATVEIVEILGAAMDVTFSLTGPLSWVSRIPTREMCAGENVIVRFAKDEIHVFELAEDGCGQRLTID